MFFRIFLCWVATSALAPRLIGAGSLTHTDSRGRRVAIQTPVRRAAIFEFYEVLPALDCWDSVVAIGSSAYRNDLLLDAQPDLKSRIPDVGTAETVDIEALLKVKPEVVLAWPYRPENIRFMEEKGLKVATIFPNSVADLYSLIRFCGQMFERQERAENTIRRMERVLQLVRARAAQIPPGQRKKVLWLTQANRTYGGVMMPNEIIELVGGINAARSLTQRYADVSMEAIVAWNPDVIFLWNNAQISVDEILTGPLWQSLKAVRERQVYRTPSASTWSPRMPLFALWMAMKTYPELYRNTDLSAVADGFYRNVFGFPFVKAAPDDL